MDVLESIYANSTLLMSFSQCEPFQLSTTANASSKIQ